MTAHGQAADRCAAVLPRAAVHAPLRACGHRRRRPKAYREGAGLLDISPRGGGGLVGQDRQALVLWCVPPGDLLEGDRVAAHTQAADCCAAVLPCAAVHAPLRARSDGAGRFQRHLNRTLEWRILDRDLVHPPGVQPRKDIGVLAVNPFQGVDALPETLRLLCPVQQSGNGRLRFPVNMKLQEVIVLLGIHAPPETDRGRTRDLGLQRRERTVPDGPALRRVLAVMGEGGLPVPCRAARCGPFKRRVVQRRGQRWPDRQRHADGPRGIGRRRVRHGNHRAVRAGGQAGGGIVHRDGVGLARGGARGRVHGQPGGPARADGIVQGARPGVPDGEGLARRVFTRGADGQEGGRVQFYSGQRRRERRHRRAQVNAGPGEGHLGVGDILARAHQQFAHLGHGKMSAQQRLRGGLQTGHRARRIGAGRRRAAEGGVIVACGVPRRPGDVRRVTGVGRREQRQERRRVRVGRHLVRRRRVRGIVAAGAARGRRFGRAGAGFHARIIRANPRVIYGAHGEHRRDARGPSHRVAVPLVARGRQHRDPRRRRVACGERHRGGRRVGRGRAVVAPPAETRADDHQRVCRVVVLVRHAPVPRRDHRRAGRRPGGVRRDFQRVQFRPVGHPADVVALRARAARHDARAAGAVGLLLRRRVRVVVPEVIAPDHLAVREPAIAEHGVRVVHPRVAHRHRHPRAVVRRTHSRRVHQGDALRQMRLQDADRLHIKHLRVREQFLEPLFGHPAREPGEVLKTAALPETRRGNPRQHLSRLFRVRGAEPAAARRTAFTRHRVRDRRLGKRHNDLRLHITGLALQERGHLPRQRVPVKADPLQRFPRRVRTLRHAEKPGHHNGHRQNRRPQACHSSIRHGISLTKTLLWHSIPHLRVHSRVLAQRPRDHSYFIP